MQIHGMDADESFVSEGDIEAARALVDAVEGAELFLYPGDGHLFADSSLPTYDRAPRPCSSNGCSVSSNALSATEPAASSSVIEKRSPGWSRSVHR